MTVDSIPVTADERTGFPLLKLPALPFLVSWLPLAWTQLEYFLSETSDRRFDAAWYHDLVKRAGRGSTAEATPANYLTLFVRGLTLPEVRVINRWWGDGRCFVPTIEKWKQMQQAALALAPLPIEQLQETAHGLHPRALRLLQTLAIVRSQAPPDKPQQLADQMLVRNGLREFALLDKVAAGAAGIGDVHRSLEPFATNPVLALDDDNRARRIQVGVRLFMNP